MAGRKMKPFYLQFSFNEGRQREMAPPYSIRLLSVAFCLLFAALPAFAQTKRPANRKAVGKTAAVSPQFKKLAQQASAAREADRLEEAIALYLQALKLNPKWNEGWWYAGSMFYERDRYAEARGAFNNLAAIDPKFGPAWSMMGLCEFQLKEYEAALKHLRHGNGFGLGGNDELRRVARFHEAVLLNRFAQFELAYDALSRLFSDQAEMPELVIALGLTMLRMPYLPSETPADKREIVFKTGRAALFAATNRLLDAQREYKELIAAYADSPGAHYAYGVFLLRGAPDEALEEFKRELQISPKHVPARLQIAFEYIKRGEHAAGAPFAEEAVKLAPDLFAAHNALGRILLETGEIERAIKELETGAGLAPDSPEMYFALARAYARAGRPKDAEHARAEFQRLDKIRRARREGFASEIKPEDKPRN
jgi:tetratricopeptide (TPR) repeat protein